MGTLDIIQDYVELEIKKIYDDTRFNDDSDDVILNIPLLLLRTELGEKLKVLNKILSIIKRGE